MVTYRRKLLMVSRMNRTMLQLEENMARPRCNLGVETVLREKRCWTNVFLHFLLLMCGDVESNPGPRSDTSLQTSDEEQVDVDSECDGDDDRIEELFSHVFLGKLSAVIRLVEGGVCVNTIRSTDNNKETLLHKAVTRSHVDIVRYLLEKNCDITIKNKKGKTALDIARKKNKTEIVSLFEPQATSSSCLSLTDVKSTDASQTANIKNGSQTRVETSRSSSTEVSANTCEDSLKEGIAIPGEGARKFQHGMDFQLQLLIYCLVYAKEMKWDKFRLATEIPEAEKFDDVVFQYQQGGLWYFRLIQAKHRESVGGMDGTKKEVVKIALNELLSDSNTDAFGITKYFRSYIRVKQNTEENSVYSVFSGSEIKDVLVITNTDVSNEVKAHLKVIKIDSSDKLIYLKSKGIESKCVVYKLDKDKCVIDTLEKLFYINSDYHELAQLFCQNYFQNKRLSNDGLVKRFYHPLFRQVFTFVEGEKSECSFKFPEYDIRKPSSSFQKYLMVQILFFKHFRETTTSEISTLKGIYWPNVKDVEELTDKLIVSYKNKQSLCSSDYWKWEAFLASEVLNLKTHKFSRSFLECNLSDCQDSICYQLKNELEKKYNEKPLTEMKFKIAKSFGVSKSPSKILDIENLALKIATDIKSGKSVTSCANMDSYHVMLYNKVFNVKTKKFYADFVQGKILDPSLILFRQYLIQSLFPTDQFSTRDTKILKDVIFRTSTTFKRCTKLSIDVKLQEIEKFSLFLASLIKSNKGYILISDFTLEETDHTPQQIIDFKDNVRCLAGHVFVHRYGTVRFSSVFIHSDRLNGDIKLLRDNLSSLNNDDLSQCAFIITLTRFTKIYEGDIERLLPALHSSSDVQEFIDKFKLVVNYPNRHELKSILNTKIKDSGRKIEEKLFQSLLQEHMYSWLSKTFGVFYTREKAENLFKKIYIDIAFESFEGITNGYLNSIPKEYEFNENKALLEFLQSSTQVWQYECKNINIGRTRLVQSFTYLRDKCNATLLIYTLGYARIFIHRSQIFDMKTFLSCVGDSIRCNLIVIELDGKFQDNIELVKKLSEKNLAKKIILLTPENNEFDELTKYFTSIDKYLDQSGFMDLTQKSLSEAMNEDVSLQGVRVKLNSITDQDCISKIDDDKMVWKLISKAPVCIGEELKRFNKMDEKLYIPRHAQQLVVLEERILSHRFEDTDFLVLTNSDKNLNFLKKLEINYKTFNENDLIKTPESITLLDQHCAESNYNCLCDRFPLKNIHRLKFVSGEIVWIKSHGSINALLEFTKKNFVDNINIGNEIDKYAEEEIITHSNKSKIVLISDTAGMGKTIIVENLSYLVKSQNPHCWVVRIRLNNYTKVLDQCPAKKFNNSHEGVNFLVNKLMRSSTNFKLESNTEIQILIHSFNIKGNVEIFLDAFDEISPYYTDIVSNLITMLNETKVRKIWITSRPNQKDFLEKKFGEFSYILRPFSEKNQIQYLVTFWRNKGNMMRLKSCATHIVDCLIKSSALKKNTIAGIPLQIYLVAIIYEDSLNDCLYSDGEEPHIKIGFELTSLYTEFVKQKYTIYERDILGTDMSKPGVKDRVNDLFYNLVKAHEILALKTLLLDQDLTLLLNYENIDTKKHHWHRYGIVNDRDDAKCEFIHRTFAEYFLASYLCDSKEGNIQYLEFMFKNVFYDREYSFVREFLNYFVHERAESCKIFEMYVKSEDDWQRFQTFLRDVNSNQIFVTLTHERHENVLLWILPIIRRSTKITNHSLISNADIYDKKNWITAAIQYEMLNLMEQCLELDPAILQEEYFCLIVFGLITRTHDKVIRRQMYALIFEKLSSLGVNFEISKKIDGRSSILQTAILDEDMETVKWLITPVHLKGKGADIFDTDSDGRTALHLATESKNISFFKYFLDYAEENGRKLDPHHKDNDGYTCYDCFEKCHYEFYREILTLVHQGGDCHDKTVKIIDGDENIYKVCYIRDVIDNSWENLTPIKKGKNK